jgi:5,10-methylenetetrahydromethanopterin reductase
MTLRTGLLMLPAYAPARLADLAVLAESAGFDDFWLADERFFREVYACLTLCALRTRRIRLGPCVTDPYSRHPALTAMAIATSTKSRPRPPVSGGVAVSASWASMPPARPWPFGRQSRSFAHSSPGGGDR